MEGDCDTAVGAHSKIDKNQITLEAKLFSLAGSLRFYEKKTDNINKFKQLKTKIGIAFKKKYKQYYKR